MNRQARRAAKAMARHTLKPKDHQIVAVHEAGHAIAKVMTAAELGYAAKEIIAHIDIGIDQRATPSADGKIMLRSQGVTVGPEFSKEISAAAEGIVKAAVCSTPGSEAQVLEGRREFRGRVLGAGRAAGADIAQWFRARVFDAVAGPMAEAIFTNQTFRDVFWEGYAAASDRGAIAVDAENSGIPVDQTISTIHKMAVLAAYVMQHTNVWTVVLALARKLPAAGRMEGHDAVTITTNIVPEDQLTKIFCQGLDAINTFELEISKASVVVATYPDGSQYLVKGIRHISNMRISTDSTATALNYECKLPVFDEALWQAFGDGSSNSLHGTKYC
jgi:hypothetical protein